MSLLTSDKAQVWGSILGGAQAGLRKLARMTVIGLLTTSLAIGAFVVLAPAAQASTRISGQITCVDGLGVEGVWIVASNGGSGWASWWAPGMGYANFSYTLPYGGAWTVHVGCGGTPAHWEYPTNGNSTTTSSYRSWSCYSADIVWYPFCQQA
jgi:hypothetical protein